MCTAHVLFSVCLMFLSIFMDSLLSLQTLFSQHFFASVHHRHRWICNIKRAMFKWEKNETRKKQIINSTVAKTEKVQFPKEDDRSAQRQGEEGELTCPLTNLLMYAVKWKLFMVFSLIKPFISECDFGCNLATMHRGRRKSSRNSLNAKRMIWVRPKNNGRR